MTKNTERPVIGSFLFLVDTYCNTNKTVLQIMELVEFAKKNFNLLNTFKRPYDTEQTYELYPYQIDFLNTIGKNKYTHSRHSRQMGITSMWVIYFAWALLYKRNCNMLYMGPIRSISSDFLDKVGSFLKLLAKNSDVEIKFQSKLMILVGNNKLKVAGACMDALRGSNFQEIVFDNVQTSSINNIFGAISPMLEVQRDSWFHSVGFDSGLSTNNMFKEYSYHYSLHPKLTEEKITNWKRILSSKQWDVEMELDKVSEDVIPKDKIINLRVPTTTLTQITERLLEFDVSISDYIRNLIKKDLNNRK